MAAEVWSSHILDLWPEGYNTVCTYQQACKVPTAQAVYALHSDEGEVYEYVCVDCLEYVKHSSDLYYGSLE